MHCEEESGIYIYLRGIKEIFMRPAATALANTGIKPDMLSYAGVLATVPFVYFFGFNPWIAFIFLLAHF